MSAQTWSPCQSFLKNMGIGQRVPAKYFIQLDRNWVTLRGTNMFVLKMMNCQLCELPAKLLKLSTVLLMTVRTKGSGRACRSRSQPNSMPRLHRAMGGVGLMIVSTKMARTFARSHHGSVIIRMMRNHFLLRVEYRSLMCRFLHLTNILICIRQRKSRCSRIRRIFGILFPKQLYQNGMRRSGLSLAKKTLAYGESTCSRIMPVFHSWMHSSKSCLML